MDDNAARAIAKKYFGAEPDTLTRLKTGYCNYVYLVETGGKKNILRISPDTRILEGSLYWLKRLSGIGIPIPVVECMDGKNDPPYVILNYFRGNDLGDVFRELSEDQKKKIVSDVVRYQRSLASSLPMARGFGYLRSYDDPDYKNTWKEVVLAHIERSASRIAESEIFSTGYVDRVKEFLPRHDDYFAAIAPVPFMDDITTKNLLIYGGEISGLIDFDWLCFGDRLYVIALTRMSLMSLGYGLSYIDYWIAEEQLGEQQIKVLSFYTLVFCIDFMSEKGMEFNRDEIEPVAESEVSRYQDLFELLYCEVASR